MHLHHRVLLIATAMLSHLTTDKGLMRPCCHPDFHYRSVPYPGRLLPVHSADLKTDQTAGLYSKVHVSCPGTRPRDEPAYQQPRSSRSLSGSQIQYKSRSPGSGNAKKRRTPLSSHERMLGYIRNNPTRLQTHHLSAQAFFQSCVTDCLHQERETARTWLDLGEGLRPYPALVGQTQPSTHTRHLGTRDREK